MGEDEDYSQRYTVVVVVVVVVVIRLAQRRVVAGEVLVRTAVPGGG